MATTHLSFQGTVDEIRRSLEGAPQPFETHIPDDFTTLTLTVDGLGSLTESLTEFTQEAELPGGCEHPHTGERTQATQRRRFLALPDVLVLHLKRFQVDGQRRSTRRINTRLDFPEDLNMTPYMIADGSETRYILQGVVVHEGTVHHGHYWSWVRNQGQWRLYNDTTARDSPNLPDNVFDGGAYLLLYERSSRLRPRAISRRGLKNPGRVCCYANSIVQQMVNIPGFYELVADQASAGWKRQLCDLMDGLTSESSPSSDPEDPEGLITAWNHSHRGNWLQQSDAAEFAMLLITALEGRIPDSEGAPEAGAAPGHLRRRGHDGGHQEEVEQVEDDSETTSVSDSAGSPAPKRQKKRTCASISNIPAVS